MQIDFLAEKYNKSGVSKTNKATNKTVRVCDYMDFRFKCYCCDKVFGYFAIAVVIGPLIRFIRVPERRTLFHILLFRACNLYFSNDSHYIWPCVHVTSPNHPRHSFSVYFKPLFIISFIISGLPRISLYGSNQWNFTIECNLF